MNNKMDKLINEMVKKILKGIKYNENNIDYMSDFGDRIFIDNIVIRTWNIYERTNKLYVEYSIYNDNERNEHGPGVSGSGRYVLNTDTNKSRIYRD